MSIYYKGNKINWVKACHPRHTPERAVSMFSIDTEDMNIDSEQAQLNDLWDYFEESPELNYYVKVVGTGKWVSFDDTSDLSTSAFMSELDDYDYLSYRYGDHVSLKEWEDDPI